MLEKYFHFDCVILFTVHLFNRFIYNSYIAVNEMYSERLF